MTSLETAQFLPITQNGMYIFVCIFPLTNGIYSSPVAGACKNGPEA